MIPTVRATPAQAARVQQAALVVPVEQEQPAELVAQVVPVAKAVQEQPAALVVQVAPVAKVAPAEVRFQPSPRSQRTRALS